MKRNGNQLTINGELPARDLRGVCVELKAMRQNPNHKLVGKWCNNGKKRTPLYAALMRLRAI